MEEPAEQEALPRRDLVLLPLISLATALLLAGSAELVARTFWPEQSNFECTYRDASGFARHKANCVERLKYAEGPWITYDFNGCGFRSQEPCGAKPPGTVRFVLMGTSIALGANVGYADLMSTRAEGPLSKLWNKRVEFQNMGEIGPKFSDLYEISDEVLAQKPDMVIFLLMPYDLKRFEEPSPADLQAPDLLGYLRDFQDRLRSSRAALVAMSHLLEREDFTMDTYLKSSDANDITRVPVSEHVKHEFDLLDSLIQKLGSKMQGSRVPLLVFPIPNRKEAAFLCRKEAHPAIDGGVFTRKVGEICRKEGADFIDVSPAMARLPKAERLYYPLDGHLNALGHQFLAEQLVEHFREHGIPN